MKPTLTANPCQVGCGAIVARSTREHAICKTDSDLSYAEFKARNQDALRDPSAWQRRVNAFHASIEQRVALAQAARARGVAA